MPRPKTVCLVGVVLFLCSAIAFAGPTLVDRVLAPDAIARDAALAGPPNRAKNRTEALQHYERGLVFSRQEAWKEAENAFRSAEKKYGEYPEYQFATAYAYLKLHRPDDALKRYGKIYKKEPTNLRALVGMAASHEEALQYVEAVRMWSRYVKMPLPAADLAEGQRRLLQAQKEFAANYEIAENPTGGPENALSPADERELGMMEAKRLSSSGVPLLEDAEIAKYVERLCARLAPHAKGFSPDYQLYVLDSPDVQASTVPGFIFVYRGLLETVTSESQLAGVLAHEIGHSVAHHSAKKFTKLVKDEQQLKSLQQKEGKLAKTLAWLVEAGRPFAFLSFSREEEAQADRLAVHIAYDAGYDPNGLAEMFRMFESMSPSSRKRWDLMLRSHPFSIDRMNTTREYAALLPAKAVKATSPEFTKMKARLKTLPPPKPPTPPAPETPASPPAGATREYTVNYAPFAGEMPADWQVRKTNYGTLVFEGEKGSEAYEATIELQITPKAEMPPDLPAVVRAVNESLARKPGVKFLEPERTHHEGQPAAIVRASYQGKTARGLDIGYRHVVLVVQYPEWWVLLNYYLPDELFEKYAPVFQAMVGTFHKQ